MIEIDIPFTKSISSQENPSYAHEGDAGIDLRSSIDCVIPPHERMVVSTGVAFAIPNGYAGLVIPRSGLAAKHGISIVNAPGLIDSSYRGEIKVILVNLDTNKPFEIKKGDRIAQIMFVPYAQGHLILCDSLDNTTRGVQGFGSSGIN